MKNDRYTLPPIKWIENFSGTFELAEYNLKFIKDDLEKIGKSNILAIEEKKSILEVLKEKEGINEYK